MPQLLPSITSRAPPQRAVLRLVRVRRSRDERRDPTPTALPCHDYYDMYPDAVGPIGNIIVTDPAEFQQWQLVARAVSVEEAHERGGCIAYTPSTPVGGSTSAVVPTQAQYLCITDTDDVVYGRGCYLPHPSRRARAKKRCSASLASVSSGISISDSSSKGGYTDEEGESSSSV